MARRRGDLSVRSPDAAEDGGRRGPARRRPGRRRGGRRRRARPIRSTFRGMPGDGPGRPRICLGASPTADEAQIRRLKQIGVSHVLMGGPAAPWKEDELKARLDRFKAGGIEIINMMIGGFNDVIWGGPKAEEQTANVVESIKVAGKLGLPVVEYNFYAHRLTEGYKLEEGRAGAGYTAYDYTLSKDLPPREGVGTHTRAQQLERAGRFLKTIVPVAEKANVRLALHPERSAGAAVARLRADHGQRRALEDVPGSGEEPVQRHDLRLRRDARDGRGSGQGVPLSVRARLHQPRPLPQRGRAHALRRLHRGVPRRRPGRPVRRDARAGEAQVPARHLSRASAAASTWTASTRSSRTSIPAAAASPARSTTSATLGPCCRPRSRSDAWRSIDTQEHRDDRATPR